MFKMFQKKQELNSNKLIVSAMLKRRRLASSAIVKITENTQKIRLVK